MFDSFKLAGKRLDPPTTTMGLPSELGECENRNQNLIPKA